MLLLIAFICFAVLIVACVVAPTSVPKAIVPAPEELPSDARQPVMA